MTTLQDVNEFLSKKRLALVGVSRGERDFTRSLFREFARRGYDVVPVNPNVSEVDGRACFARLQDITPPVEGALLMTPSKTTDAVVEDCVKAGIKRVWMYRAGGAGGAVSGSAVQTCEANGIRVVAGCPHMFWSDSNWFHHMHGFLVKLTGKYPR